ncbi:hypothetical protein OQJ46_13085 [Microbulbifer thermotolerans]|uniref:hypothetical protein n=1 Tax=Microbulbifer thermotolerans TaxID=252514 RepID=UPI0022491020|nr:hypothetical protein [Microbulbifer thermotolerans]MCX2778453.1 hypothetical protein [Microbulbifer thermotolerans]MCX2783923.1 hypothetical protein [Microbulbifer thermotolerans]MCX2805620.1 hypothetical protein [Microbulbifer thermotolerans]MCX2830869.1 hypothetical protein [Microbulbifer thermotolerans]
MRNYIKYPPFEWREHKGQCIPRGPSFRWAREVTIRLTNCTLALRLPRHAPEPGGDSGEWRILPRIYELEGRNHNDRRMPSQSWRYEGIVARNWAFYGPWFTGCMGKVHFSLVGLRLSEPNPQINFLHPKALETAALSYITASWGHEVYGSKPYYQAPLNWTPLHELPVPTLCFDMKRVIQAGVRYRFIFFPVGRDKLIKISFSCYQYATGTQEEIDARISPEPMLELVENILGSLQVSLSPELQREVDAVREAYPDAAVSPDCPPLDWPAHVDRDGLTILPYDEKLYAEPVR